MNLLRTLSLGLAASFFMHASGNAQSLPTPEFRNKVQSVQSDKTLQDLDNTDLVTEYISTMTTAAVNIKAMGKTAAVTHSGKVTDQFIVMIGHDIDPSDAVELIKFEVDKKSRKVKVNSMKVGVSKDVQIPKQKLKFTKVQPGVWLISLEEELAPGEYFFIINRPNIDVMGYHGGKTLKGFCFRVG